MAERITGHTELIGLMAYPIRHSSSPAMQNEAFAKLGYDYAYLAFEVGADEIEDAVKAIRTLKMRGSNVSMPNKTLVGKYLDELSPAAELCGAVNTIVNDNGHLTGHITDGIGFMSALKDNDIDVIGKKMGSKTAVRELCGMVDLNKIDPEYGIRFLYSMRDANVRELIGRMGLDPETVLELQDIGPVIGTHIGDGCVAIACFWKEK